MCAIFAFAGASPKAHIITLNGLEKLKYRGYDSAGVAFYTGQNFVCHKALGDIKNLKKKLKPYLKQESSLALGHTRWATQGKVSINNAHPHSYRGFYLVHNGVIENAEELKQKCKGPFLSETDSEVLLHLLISTYKKRGSLKASIIHAFKKVKGQFSVVLTSLHNPDTLWAFKRGPSLCLGLGAGFKGNQTGQNKKGKYRDIFIASDPRGFLTYTDQVFSLEDGDIIEASHLSGIKFSNAFSSNKKRGKIKTLKLKTTDSFKSKIPSTSLMHKEILEQTQCFAHILKLNKTTKQPGIKTLAKHCKSSPPLHIVACGSSYLAALYGKYAFDSLCKTNLVVELASEFLYRNSPWFFSNKTSPPLLLISQSGETADTLAVARKVKKCKKPKIFSLCNVPFSSLAKESHYIPMQVGEEKAVASTKSFTATLVHLLLIAKAITPNKITLNTLPKLSRMVTEREREFAKIAKSLVKFSSFMFLGRNVWYPIAREGALKVMELSYKPALALPAGEMKHGPLAYVDRNVGVVAVVGDGVLRDKTLTNLREIKSRGGKMLILAGAHDRESQNLSSLGFIPLPAIDHYIGPILATMVFQFLAYYMAIHLRHNVDQPRNLAKSVTVE